jgi:hypothetical protein
VSPGLVELHEGSQFAERKSGSRLNLDEIQNR